MSSLIKIDDRFFIAGARGMAGSSICRVLKKKGYGDEAKGGALLAPSRQELDLFDAKAVEAWYEKQKPDVVVLAAAKVGGINANETYPADFLAENLKIQMNVIEGAWKAGVKRLLFLGSSCIYPKFADQPIKEEALLTGSLEPTNEWYAIAKIAGIKLCEALRKQHGFDAISLMPTNLYGPGDNYHRTNSHVLPALIRRFHEAAEAKSEYLTCWGTGTPLREFLHVDDLGDACVFALEHWRPAPGDISYMNVGTGIDMSIRALAETVAKATNYKGKIFWDSTKPDGTPKTQLDVGRLAALGWRARISLEDGLMSTVSLYREQLKKERAMLKESI